MTATRPGAGPLAGRKAYVTGGSRGIGAATALRLAQDGADVAFSFSASPERAARVADTLRGLGGAVHAVRADQADAHANAVAVDTVVERLGGLDILVNSAGVMALGPVTQVDTLPDVRRMYDVNTLGVAVTTHAAAAHLSDFGRVVNVSSMAAHRIVAAGMAEYAASKAAVAALTRGWARDFGDRGITVNAVAPGPIDTDMNPGSGPMAGVQIAATPLGRFGRPDEVAAAIAWLAGPDAAYVTGTVLTIDGGLSI